MNAGRPGGACRPATTIIHDQEQASGPQSARAHGRAEPVRALDGLGLTHA